MAFKDMTYDELVAAQGVAVDEGDFQYAQDIEDYLDELYTT